MRAYSTVKKNFHYGAPGLGDRVHSILLSYNYGLLENTQVMLHLTKYQWNRHKPESWPEILSLFPRGSVAIMPHLEYEPTSNQAFVEYVKNKGYKNIFHLKGGILKYLEEISKEESLFEGECYVFDKRVSLDHELKKGSYSICHACGMPISLEDKKKKEYIEGIQCHFCINQFTDEDRKRFEERQKQINTLKKNQKVIKN